MIFWVYMCVHAHTNILFSGPITVHISTETEYGIVPNRLLELLPLSKLSQLVFLDAV